MSIISNSLWKEIKNAIPSKKSIIVDINGAPLAIAVGPSNKHDTKFFVLTLNKLNMKNFDIIAADSAFDSQKLRNLCKKNKINLNAATNK